MKKDDEKADNIKYADRRDTAHLEDFLSHMHEPVQDR